MAGAGIEHEAVILEVAKRIEQQVGTVVLGKPSQVRLAVATLLAGEHLLLSDLPGVGKTTLASALARVAGGTLGRIQGTPDLLPTDLTGSSIYDQGTGAWNFRAGPLMNHVVVVDELNRITPRTQSALLQAMAEREVTVDGVTRPVPLPFMVVGTMNPVGSAGTFPITAAQLDRFGMVVGLGPVDRPVERQLLTGHGGASAVEAIVEVIPVDMLPQLQTAIAGIHMADAVLDYALDVCDTVRTVAHLSTRAARSLLSIARALAVLDGRIYLVPDDIKNLAVPCLAHRLVAEGEPIDGQAPAVRSRVEDLPVPSTVT